MDIDPRRLPPNRSGTGQKYQCLRALCLFIVCMEFTLFLDDNTHSHGANLVNEFSENENIE